MKQLRHQPTAAARRRGRRKSPAALACAVLLIAAQTQFALADIFNSAEAVATYGGNPIASTAATESIPVVTGTPAMAVVKTGTLNDDDGTAGVSAGDTIDYTVTVQNTGNLSLTAVALSDPLVTLAYASGDAANPGVLDVAETWIYTGTYVLTQSDLDGNGGGDGDIDNTATANSSAGALTVQASGSDAIALNIAPSLIVTKTADDTTDVIAGQTVTYTYVIANTGNQTVTNITLNDVHNASGAAPTPGSETLTADTRTIGDSTDATANDGVWSVLSPGDTVTFTATYTVTQTDVDTLQ